jgi:iron complex outermembrane recepter protein
VITAEDIEETGAQTIVDVLQREPGVFSQNYLGNPKAANIDVRGYGEAAPQNVLVLVDGRRVNAIDISGADLSHIPVDAVERIEVYRGVGSVLYGDNAAGGVINIILKTGEGSPKATMSATIGSDNFFKPELMITGKQGKLSYLVLTSALDTEGYRRNNGFYAKDGLGNFEFDALNNLKLKLSAGHHRDSYGQPGALFWAELHRGIVDPKDSTRSYETATASTEDNFINFEPEIKLKDNVVLSLGGSYRNRHIASFFDYGAGNFFDSMGQLQTYAFTPKVAISSPLGRFKNILILGSDWYKYSTTANTSVNFFGSPSVATRDIDKKDFAFYATDKFSPFSNLMVEAGYRKQRSAYDIRNLDLTSNVSEAGTSRYDREAYRFSANYSFVDKASVFVSYGRGFRFPATDEFISWGYYDSWSGVFVPTQINRALKPQTTDEFDVGFRWNPYRRFAGTVTYFRATNKDEIYLDPLTFANANYDKTSRQGIEAALFFNVMTGLTLNVTYSYTEALFDGGPFDGNRIPLVPNNKASARLTYALANWDFTVASVYTGDRYAISDQANAQRTLPGYTTFDASIGFRYKKLAAMLTVKNFTDKDYSEIGAYSPFRNDIGLYPSPGRQFFLTMKYTLGE